MHHSQWAGIKVPDAEKSRRTEESRAFLTKHTRHQPLHFGVDSPSSVQSQCSEAYTNMQTRFTKCDKSTIKYIQELFFPNEQFN